LVRYGWLAPTLLTLALTLTGLGRAQLWRDELASWSAATRAPADLLRMAGTIDAATSPWYLLLHGWVTLFGDSVTALRLPSALAVAGAAGLTTRLGQRVLGTRAGLLGGLLFAVLPGTSRYGQEARPYALVALLAVLATLLLVGSGAGGGWARRVGYPVTVALLGLTHLVALTLLAAHAVVVLAGGGPGRLRRFGCWLLALVPAGLLLVPLLLVARGQRSRQLDWVDPARLTDLTALPTGLAQSATLGGLLLGLAALGGIRRGRAALVPGLCLLLPVLLLFLAGLVVPLWVPRYLFFTLPFGCLLAGAALTLPARTGADLTLPARTGADLTLPARTGAGHRAAGTGGVAAGSAAGRSARWAGLPGGLALVALVGLVGIPDQVALRRTHEWPRTAAVDYRGAAGVIAAGRQSGDAVVYSPREGWLLLDLGLGYHLRGRDRPADPLLVADQVERGDLWATECPRPAGCLTGVDRVWLLVAGRPADPLAAVPGPKGDALRAGYRRTEVWRRPGLTVALLTRR
jgi:mannosyltransferase